MKIDQTQAVISSQAVTRIERQDSSQLRFWQERPQFELPEQPDNIAVPTASSETASAPLSMSTVLTFDQFDISKQGLQVSYSLSTDSSAVSVPGEVRYEISNEDQINIMMIENFMRRLTGKEVNLHIPIKIIIQRTPIAEVLEIRQGKGFEIDPAKSSSLSASLGFAEDGREIRVNLDSNGTSDQISRLIEGNGFLALALNIDENDLNDSNPIFDQLRIWEQRDDGSSTLLALGESGIGAVYFGHMSNVFDLKSDVHSDIYQKERGTGPIHQLDMVL